MADQASLWTGHFHGRTPDTFTQVIKPVDDGGHHHRDDQRIGEGFLHVQPVDDEDTGGRLDELLELVGEPAFLVQELGGHQGWEGLLVGHPLAQIVGLPAQAPYGRETPTGVPTAVMRTCHSCTPRAAGSSS